MYVLLIFPHKNSRVQFLAQSSYSEFFFEKRRKMVVVLLWVALYGYKRFLNLDYYFNKINTSEYGNGMMIIIQS